MLRPILFLVLILGATWPLQARETNGPERILATLDGVLPAPDSSPERATARLGIQLALVLPQRQERLAVRVLETLSERLQALVEALEKNGEATPTGALHRQLELRQVEASDALALLTEQARAEERAARDIPDGVGRGGLRTALALEEVLRAAGSNLTGLARSVRQAADGVRSLRRVLGRMLVRLEEIQDQNPGSDRDRVPLSARGGTHGSLVRGLRGLEPRLTSLRKALESVRSLRRVRYLALEETLRNLASGASRPGDSLRDMASVATNLQAVLVELENRERDLTPRVQALEAGRQTLPSLPPLPDWLFTQAGRIPEAPPAVSAATQESLALLDELEEDLGDGTQLVENPLTATLAETFRDRHAWEQGYAIEELSPEARPPDAL